MAVYNEVQVGRYVRFLQKFLSIKGRQPAPLQFSGELSSFFSLFHGVENRYLEGWNRFVSAQNFVASAANVNAARFRNPANSAVVAVFEKILVGSIAVGGVQWIITNGAIAADLTTVQSQANARLDPRGNPTPSIILSSAQAAAVAGLASSWNFFLVGSAAGLLPQLDVIIDENQEIPLLPGDGLQFVTSAVNVASSILCIWRERILEESERT